MGDMNMEKLSVGLKSSPRPRIIYPGERKVDVNILDVSVYS